MKWLIDYLTSSIGRKILMALTGLFLVTFLLGHLAGNLQLLVPGYAGKLAFNEYAVFMTTNPAVKIMSYITYFAILLHVIVSIIIIARNRKARPVKYAHSKMGGSSSLSSRNMGILGTLVLVFIILHLSNFWYKYKHCPGCETPIMMDKAGKAPLLMDNAKAVAGGKVVWESAGFMAGNKAIIKTGKKKVGYAMKDLHEVVKLSFGQIWYVLLYVLAMIAVGFHLWHGFQSGFQTLGLSHAKYSPIIALAGKLFAVIIPLLFALIPVVMFIRSLA